MIGRILIGIVVAAILAAGAWWAVENFERVSVEEWVGLSGEARQNELLAAQRLLTRMGMQARTATSLAELDALPPKGVLLLSSRRQSISEPQQRRILEWIAAGGLALIDAEWPNEADPLFDEFAIDRAADSVGDRRAIELRLPHTERTFQVELGRIGSLALYDGQSLFEFGDSQGAKVIALEHGAGKVLAFVSFEPFTNNAIGRLDHAEFLWQLTRWHALTTPGATESVLIFNRPGKLSLWQWLVDSALLLMITLGVLLGAWLWRTAIRFGPIRPDPLPAQRRLIDHIAASGRFEWRHRGAARLLEASRTRAIVRARRIAPELVPEFVQAQPGRAIEVLAAATGLGKADAERAIRPLPEGATPAFHDFQAVVGLHQRIEHAVDVRLAKKTSQERA